MNLWTIVGWIVVAILAVRITILAVRLAAIPWHFAVVLVRHLRTRGDAPAEGQRWRQGDATLRIKRVTDEGRIVMETGSASWSDSPEQWRERVRNRLLWRVR